MHARIGELLNAGDLGSPTQNTSKKRSSHPLAASIKRNIRGTCKKINKHLRELSLVLDAHNSGR